jgi:hypothetical protein
MCFLLLVCFSAYLQIQILLEKLLQFFEKNNYISLLAFKIQHFNVNLFYWKCKTKKKDCQELISEET